MTRIVSCLCVVAAVLCATVAVGQVQSDTPKIIEIVTEDGLTPSGSGLEAILRGMKSQTQANALEWIGATVVAGELNHAVAIFAHRDFASLMTSSKALKAGWQALPAAKRPRLQSRVYDFAPEQTYNDGHVLWKDAHAFILFFTELSSGGADDYAEQQRIAAGYLAKAKVQDEEWLGFSLRFGHGSPGFVFVTPLRAIAELDAIASHGDVLPADVDKARSAVLLRAVKSNSLTLLQVRPELSKFELH